MLQKPEKLLFCKILIHENLSNGHLQKFIPSKYTRYTVVNRALTFF